jgi:hypothetical protein
MTSRLAAFSLILYDFSNTVFSVAVLSFFPLWVEEPAGSGGLRDRVRRLVFGGGPFGYRISIGSPS